MLGLLGVILFGSIFVLLYIWNKKRQSYWQQMGIPQINPLPFIGNMLPVLTFRQNFGQMYEQIYFENMDKKYIGLYEIEKPALMVRDLSLIENILVKDFSYFVNRGIDFEDKSDVGKTLAGLRDNEWRAVRYKTIPAFSSGKMKNMFDTMRNSVDRMIKYIDSSQEDVDIKEVSSRYAIDVIGTCAFGIDVTQHLDPKSEFRQMGRLLLNCNTLGYFILLFLSLLPSVALKMGFEFTLGKVGNYFGKLIRDAIRTREVSKAKRNDFIDLLLELKVKGSIPIQSKDPEDSYLKLDYEPVSENIEITDAIVISQAFTFLQAGFDGLSNPTACILYELAKNSVIQDNARTDLYQQMDKYGGLTYEAVKNAKYLECCLHEGLRLYPLTNFHLRESNKEYELEPGVYIEKGTKIVICSSGSQIDSTYYKDPLVFNPDRYVDCPTTTITDYSYLPFGGGPRMCIAMRFAQLIMKLELAAILANYELKLSPRSPKHLEMKVQTFFANQLAHPVYFNVSKIQNKYTK